MDKPIFENKKFSELFTIVSKEESRDIPHVNPAWINYGVTPPVKHKAEKSRITGFMYFRVIDGEWKDSIYVKPSDSVVEFIKNSMLAINHDSISFKVVIFSNGDADIYAEYNLIIGSWYLARVSAKEITDNVKYQFHVLVENQKSHKKEFKAVRPTGGIPYEYDTRKEAEDMAKMCYGSCDSDSVKIVKVVK